MRRGAGSGELFPEPAVDEQGALYAEVAVPLPVPMAFSYRVPPALAALTRVGTRVRVPFGKERQIGFVVATSRTKPSGLRQLREVERVLDEQPVLGPELLELGRWIASYYACSLGEALGAMLPAALRHGREGRKRRMVRAAPEVGASALAELERSHPKQHRLLRALLEVGCLVEERVLLQRLNLSASPLRSLEARGWVKAEHVAPALDLEGPAAGVERRRPERLSDDQARALACIEDALASSAPRTFLLRGVTGSGKTEVYLRTIEAALRLGRGAIVLVPEIALTPQTVSWFRSRFEAVAVLHSRLTDVERLKAWRALQKGEVRVVVGARSALFAPLERLGVIVVDEEHEPSFKQGSTPRYHARDLAVVRAKRAGAVCILGSATPALESWRNAQEGRYELLELEQRVGGGRLPEVEIVDMRREKAEGGAKGPLQLFSRSLGEALRAAHARGEQAMLFVNRRGFAPVLWCRACGESLRCEHCDVALTYHRRIRRAVCHSCCEELEPPEACPTCTAPGLRLLGIGAERVQEALRLLLPEARVQRMDSDTMLRREDYENVLAAFARGELDVLVGTQMIAKGLDFPRVTVVGIVSADSNLHLPDFRAAERTFQLISQVSGRAGRGTLAGRIIVQTLVPDHPAIRCAARHDYKAFASIEGESRADLDYPPYGRLIRVVLEDEEEPRTREAAEALREELEPLADTHGFALLGPAPAPIERLRGRYRYNLLLKSPRDGQGLPQVKELLLRTAARLSRPRIAIDVDPSNML